MPVRTVKVLKAGYVRGDSSVDQELQVNLTDDEMKLLEGEGIAKEMKARSDSLGELTEEEQALVRDYRAASVVQQPGVIVAVDATDEVAEITGANTDKRKGK